MRCNPLPYLPVADAQINRCDGETSSGKVQDGQPSIIAFIVFEIVIKRNKKPGLKPIVF